METAQHRVEHPTFETVWAALQEVSERQKETDRLIKEYAEQQKEDAKQWAKQREEDSRQMKEDADRRAKQRDEDYRRMKERADQFDKRFGSFTNRFGEMVEHMVLPNMLKGFRALGIVFDKAYNNAKIEDANGRILFETDITLESGDKVMIVEVKTKLDVEDVTEHIKHMEKVRAYADKKGDKRIYLGAVAAMIIYGNERIFALKNGFYVIEPSGETFDITPPQGIYFPREWLPA